MSTSLNQAREYVRAKMVSLGYSQHMEAFNVENIPATRFNKRFHIETPTGGRVDSYGAGYQQIEHDIVLRLFMKGGRGRKSLTVDLEQRYEAILAAVLKDDTRFDQDFKNLKMDRVDIRPYDETNDNSAILEITFTCLIFVCT